MNSKLEEKNAANKQTNKQRFRPIVTRIKLNPEQAVLSCDCYNYGLTWTQVDAYYNFYIGTSYLGCTGKSIVSKTACDDARVNGFPTGSRPGGTSGASS